MHTIFGRILCIFLALQLLNCSVDAPDALNNLIPEDLNYNEQESVIEILIEKVFGFGNMIAEFDDDDSSDQTSGKKLLSVDFFVLPDLRVPQITISCILSEDYGSKPDFYPDAARDTFSPPPEV